MYLRTNGRRNKDGSEVRYVQLAHNEWDPRRKRSVARVIHSLGREDRLDRAALARLMRSLSRVLEPEQALIATAPAEAEFVRSVPLGGAWAPDGLWRQLGIDVAIERLLAARRLDVRAQRLVFALVANRALAPFSKLALHQGSFRGSAGLVHKTSETTATQLRILRALALDPPPTITAFSLAA